MSALSASPLRILIVEDEPLYAEQLEAALEDLGYHCLGAVADGAAALALIDQHGWPDVALLDINLRGALDGVALGALLLAEHPLPLLFLTSRADPETFARARHLGPAAYLVKPVALDALQRAIELAVVNFATAQRAGSGPGPSEPEATPAATFAGSNTGVLLPEALFVKDEGLLTKVLLADVQWVAADGKHCQLALAGRLVQVRQPLRELARLLPTKQFVQIQRSYLVNVSYIERIDPVHNLVQVADQLLPLGLTYRDELLRRLQLA